MRPLQLFFLLVVLVLTVLVHRYVWGRYVRHTALPPLARRVLQFALGTVLVLGGASILAYEPPRVTELPIRLPGLPRTLEGFTLVQLSDLHVGPLLRERYLDELVSRTNALRGDLVAITGDLVDGSTTRLGAIVSRLSHLRSRHGTFFVTGNHDYASGADA